MIDCSLKNIIIIISILIVLIGLYLAFLREKKNISTGKQDNQTGGGNVKDGSFNFQFAIGLVLILMGLISAIYSIKNIPSCVEHQTNKYFHDRDHDGYGNVQNRIIVEDSIPPKDYVVDSTDCCDDNSLLYDKATAKSFYEDKDADGYGNNAKQILANTTPTGYVENNQDCDDANDKVHPNQIGWFETPTTNGSFDYDCDGKITLQFTALGHKSRSLIEEAHCVIGAAFDCCYFEGWISFIPNAGLPNDYGLGCLQGGVVTVPRTQSAH